MWSGADKEKRAQAGIGCIVHKSNIKNTIKKWEAVSERILIVEVKHSMHEETMNTVYGPNEDERAQEK